MDTETLRSIGFGVQEVSGGCFCCRFDHLVSASQQLVDRLDPDVLIGEPVGSCTDISATVLQPMKRLYGDRFRLSTFSVLVDPARLEEALEARQAPLLPQSVIYIFLKQLEEADLIVLNKCDLLSPEQRVHIRALAAEAFPDKPIHLLSARTSEGVDAWLEMMFEDTPAGRYIAQIDYDTYAEGEAMLGWLNASASLSADKPTDWRRFAERLMGELKDRFRAASAQIAHLKVFLRAADGSLSANLTNAADEVYLTPGGIPPSLQASMTLNARAHLDPETLKATILDALETAKGEAVRVVIDRVQSFSPARPAPTYRFDTAI